MADAKISDLAASTTPLAGTELAVIVQGGVTKQVAVSEFGGGGGGGGTGSFGISDALGVYTYYTTLTLAIAAAVSGDVIQVFADITETGSVEITLKDGVHINGNGYTYTLDNSGTIHAMKASSTTSCNILNYHIIRTGSTADTLSNAVFNSAIGSTGTFNFTGSTFTNLGSGSGIMSQGSSYITNAKGVCTNSVWGGILSFSLTATFVNCIGIASGAGYGFRCHTGGKFTNCYGESDSGTGFYLPLGTAINCTGISVSGIGQLGGGDSIDCVGRSTSGVGFQCTNQETVFNCTGISVSGIGFDSGNNNPVEKANGISSSNYGISLGTNVLASDVFSRSESQASIRAGEGNEIRKGTIISNWNDAAGYGIVGNGGLIASTIQNCVFNLSNASAPYLYNGVSAQAIAMANNTYEGGGAFNVNLTNSITNTADSQGNLYI